MIKAIEPKSYSQVLKEMESAIHEHKAIYELNKTELTSWHALCESTYERMVKAIAAFTEYEPSLRAAISS